MLWQFLSWYLALQLVSLAALPLTIGLLANLPDRGYAFSKSVGVLAVGFLFWIGYSYGFLRNETGGAWLSLLLVALFSWAVGRQAIQSLFQPAAAHPERPPLSLRYILGIELIFLAFFGLWALVRAYDPAVNHTEEPMDLMFMNSIWVSATYPPQDAWLGGYAISYYYFGYWLLTTLGRLANQPPELAYTLGQASWYGLLWIGCFGMGYNLLARRYGKGDGRAVAGGFLAGLLVATVGNLQAVMEWLHANGYPVTAFANWLGVRNFPAEAPQTGLWYISLDWWWWRPSRVISDRWLTGDHMEVIDEFPMFSYILGDNHPHVLAMPFALLMIALIYNLFLQPHRLTWPAAPLLPLETGATGLGQAIQRVITLARTAVPFGFIGIVALIVVGGALVFLNTWDFPPYWLLFMVTVALLCWRLLGTTASLKPTARGGQALVAAGIAGSFVLFGLLCLYFPYFLTAQSQAGGLVPNLFNPSRFSQFLVMFGFALLGIVTLLLLSWQALPTPVSTSSPTHWLSLGVIGALVYGLPLLVLLVSTLLATTPRGQSLLAAHIALPEGATSYLPFILQRWSTQFWTFLIVGALLSLVLWLAWRHGEGWQAESEAQPRASVPQATLFVLLLAALGLFLAFVPEFLYLRDNFGTRMNTVFKFYYQAWLLFGLAVSYAIVVGLSALLPTAQEPATGITSPLLRWVTGLGALLTLLLALSGLIFPVAAAYSKTGAFAATPTFDATAYLAEQGPAELAAADWVRANTAPTALVIEGKGASYWSNYNRISTLTGRPTLLGWDGHEAQWRGKAFGAMAQGRVEALDLIYGSRTPTEITRVLTAWNVDYVYVGPTERSQYGITAESERALAMAMELAFEQGDVRIYQRRR
ncbi:MAG: hypothetical protein KF832_27520 [Caldilineaceae bacterium]|nr:hypothetical protein [Caldilineaceae bacterium]